MALLDGESVSLEEGFDILKVHAQPSLFLCLCIKMQLSNTAPVTDVPAAMFPTMMTMDQTSETVSKTLSKCFLRVTW